VRRGKTKPQGARKHPRGGPASREKKNKKGFESSNRRPQIPRKKKKWGTLKKSAGKEAQDGEPQKPPSNHSLITTKKAKPALKKMGKSYRRNNSWQKTEEGWVEKTARSTAAKEKKKKRKSKIGFRKEIKFPTQ